MYGDYIYFLTILLICIFTDIGGFELSLKHINYDIKNKKISMVWDTFWFPFLTNFLCVFDQLIQNRLLRQFLLYSLFNCFIPPFIPFQSGFLGICRNTRETKHFRPEKQLSHSVGSSEIATFPIL